MGRRKKRTSLRVRGPHLNSLGLDIAPESHTQIAWVYIFPGADGGSTQKQCESRHSSRRKGRAIFFLGFSRYPLEHKGHAQNRWGLDIP